MNDCKMVVAETPDRGRMWYLINAHLDFVPEVKQFLDWKQATRHAPATIKSYCSRLLWLYRFLASSQIEATAVNAAHLTEFVLWLQFPARSSGPVEAAWATQALSAGSINDTVEVVAMFYRFLVRRGLMAQSPIVYMDGHKGKWAIERDLLAHTRRGSTRPRLELRVKEPTRRSPTITEQDFVTFVNAISQTRAPQDDPGGFRDRLICLMLKEGGFRVGELLGMHVEDLAAGQLGVYVRFRADNENAARAKAGYGRDRFVSLPPSLLGLLDLYLTEIWVEAGPTTDLLWIILNRRARNRDGQATYGAALSIPAVESMFRHYSSKSGISLHPHMLRHSHATELARSYLREGQAVDWKFIQARLGHASVVTTMQTYAHLESEDYHQAYQAFLDRKEATRVRNQQNHV